MDPTLLQYLTQGGIGALVVATWRLGTYVGRQNGAMAALAKEFGEHKLEDRSQFFRLNDRLDRRGWFGWGR